MKAMILAAGKGTRMLPLTENKPKALIEVQGVTLLEHTIRYLKYHGFNEIVINIHHHAAQIVDFVKKNESFGIRIEFSDESDSLLDTGGGLYKARGFFDDHEPFLLTSADVITDLNLKDLILFHKTRHPLVSLAVKKRQSTRDFIFDKEYRLCGWRKNATGETRFIKAVNNPQFLAFSTIHMIDPAIFNLITERNSFSIVDAYLRLASGHLIMGFDHSQSAWFECGRLENYEKINQISEIQTIYSTFHSLPEENQHHHE